MLRKKWTGMGVRAAFKKPKKLCHHQSNESRAHGPQLPPPTWAVRSEKMSTFLPGDRSNILSLACPVVAMAFAPLGNKRGEEEGIATMLESTYRPGTLTMLECRFNKTTHHPTTLTLNQVPNSDPPPKKKTIWWHVAEAHQQRPSLRLVCA